MPAPLGYTPAKGTELSPMRNTGSIFPPRFTGPANVTSSNGSVAGMLSGFASSAVMPLYCRKNLGVGSWTFCRVERIGGAGALKARPQAITTRVESRAMAGDLAEGAVGETLPARVNLLRRSKANPAYIASKKWIIRCFSAREFTESSGWSMVPFGSVAARKE